MRVNDGEQNGSVKWLANSAVPFLTRNYILLPFRKRSRTSLAR